MNTVVFDVGKTHVKLHLLDGRDRTLAVVETENRPLTTGPYPAADVEGIWRWLLDNLKTLQARFGIQRISVTTHGATAALVNPESGDDGLVTPVLDYEYEGVESLNGDYNRIRPDFSETGSPNLPAGLNLGRQLYWLSKTFPEKFARSSHILLYPQYWVWRLAGRGLSEVTSLGCHTDLWAPWRGTYSSLVAKLGWDDKFPPLANAWEIAGSLREDICAATGLPENCVVHVGVHDSNASYLRYKKAMPDQPFAVVSTGTWSIVMNGFADPSALQERRDMLANVDVTGTPVVCSRFMGGREYGRICEKLGGELDTPASESQVQAVVENGVFCLPCWQAGTGPFGTNTPEIRGKLPPRVPAAALASLYCALMLDYQLELVTSKETVVVGGAFLKNPLLCRLLAQLRADQPVLASNDITGTVMGAAQLAHWEQSQETLSLNEVQPANISGLEDYRARWTELCESATEN